MIGTATSEQGARAIDAKFSQLGLKGRGAVLDVANEASVEALLADISAREGAPAILVNNAGITRDNLLLRMKDRGMGRGVVDEPVFDLSPLAKGACAAWRRPATGAS